MTRKVALCNGSSPIHFYHALPCDLWQEFSDSACGQSQIWTRGENLLKDRRDH
jgi:hypothetical protein